MIVRRSRGRMDQWASKWIGSRCVASGFMDEHQALRVYSSADKRSAWRRRTFSLRPFRPFEARIDLVDELPKNKAQRSRRGKRSLVGYYTPCFREYPDFAKNGDVVGCRSRRRPNHVRRTVRVRILGSTTSRPYSRENSLRRFTVSPGNSPSNRGRVLQ